MLFARRWLGAAAPAARDGGGRACANGLSSTSSPNAAIASACPRALSARRQAPGRAGTARVRINLLAIERRNRSDADHPPDGADRARGRRRPVPRRAHAGRRDRGAEREAWARDHAARGGRPVPDRPRSGPRDGRGHRPGGIKLIGQSVLEARVRRDYGLTVIGLRRGSRCSVTASSRRSCKSATPCSWSASGDIERLQSEGGHDLVVLTFGRAARSPAGARQGAPRRSRSSPWSSG